MQLSLFEIDAEEKIRDTFIKDLKRGSGFESGKKRIADLFDQKLTKSETIESLKNEYGVGGMSTIASGGYSQNHDVQGITITLVTGEEKHHSWDQVYDALLNLIQTDKYFKESES